MSKSIWDVRATIRGMQGRALRFQLHAEEIDAFSDWLESTMGELEVERQNRLRIRLSMEEALLRVRDRFGEEQWVDARIHVRFRRVIVQLEMEGDAFNLLSADESELANLCSSVLTSVQLTPRYTYNGRKNILRVTLPQAGMSTTLRLLLTLAASLILGAGGRILLPAVLRYHIADAALPPVYLSWWHIL